MKWRGNFDETKKLLKNIEKVLKSAGVSFKKIERIIVISGPGPFSATRIGVTVANILAFCLNAPIFGISTKKLWHLRYKAGKIRLPGVCLIHAGGNFVYRSGAGLKNTILPIEKALKLPDKPLAFFGDLTENEVREFERIKKPKWKFAREEELESLGKILASTGAPTLKKKKSVSPFYWKPPNITKPKHAT